MPVFLLLVACEWTVPIIAEPIQTPWHPHHIAERYGLFFIIVLGETILAATVAVQQVQAGEHPSWKVGYVVAGGLLIVFSVWWIYFARDTGKLLARAHGQNARGEYTFGFGHYAIFASGAAIGAGLAVRADYWTHTGHASSLVSAAMVTIPTAALLISMWLILLRRETPRWGSALAFGLAALLILAATFSHLPEVITGVVCVALLTLEVRATKLRDDRSRQSAVGSEPPAVGSAPPAVGPEPPALGSAPPLS